MPVQHVQKLLRLGSGAVVKGQRDFFGGGGSLCKKLAGFERQGKCENVQTEKCDEKMGKFSHQLASWGLDLVAAT